jgi:hypothetical protein
MRFTTIPDKVHCNEGVAIRIGPEPCVCVLMSAVLSNVFQGRMDHVPSPFGVSVLW